MRIENYKKNGPQIYHISRKYKNRFEGNHNLNNINHLNNFNNNNKKNNYQYRSYRRLSEIQKSPKYSFSKNNVNVSVTKSKSNKSLTTKSNRKLKI